MRGASAARSPFEVPKELGRWSACPLTTQSSRPYRTQFAKRHEAICWFALLMGYEHRLRCGQPFIHAGLTLREVSVVSAGTLSGGEPFQRRAPALEQSDDGQQNTEGDDGGKGRGGDGLGRVGGGEVRLGAHGNLLILNWTEWHCN